jgi:hypothetical protein
MSDDRWKMVKGLFQRALALEPDHWHAYLDRVCAGDAALRDEVASLLAEHDPRPASKAESLVISTHAGANETGAPRPAPTVPLPADGPREQVPTAPDPSALATTIFENTYYVERFLRRDDRGSVYLARHTLVQDRVALTILDGVESLERAVCEARALRMIGHPIAVAFYELRAARDGTAYEVREYVEGRTLRDELAHLGRVPPAHALPLLEPVASLLDAARSFGIVDCTIAPDDVVLVGDASARPRVRVARLMRAGSAGASVEDDRADVRGFAALAYELVGGQPPSPRPAPPLHTIASDVPEAFGALVARALDGAPDERPPTPGHIVAGLRAALRAAADAAIFRTTTSPKPPTQDATLRLAAGPNTRRLEEGCDGE